MTPTSRTRRRWFGTRALPAALCGGLLLAALVGLAVMRTRAVLQPYSDSFPGWFYETHATSARGPDILLITVDTLRPDHLGLYGYTRPTSPNLDSWFGDAEVYDHAYSTEANTTPSVVSLLTGLLPQQHGVRLLYQKISPDTVTVSDYLRRAGYDTAAVVSNVALTREATGLDTRFDYYDDHVDEPEPRRPVYERRASRTTDAALAWLTTHRGTQRPHFLWVHYIDPHGPYVPPAGSPADFTHTDAWPLDDDIHRVEDYQLEPGVTDAWEYVDRYDEEIAYVDQEVGRLLESYAGLGLADDALIVFTADHGESMMEHEQWFEHGYHVYDEIVRIPLMIRRPSGASRRIDLPVSNADLAPTILLAAGLEPPEVYGQPLPPGPHALNRDIFAEASTWRGQWRALIRGRRKWVVRYEAVRSLADRILNRLVLMQPFVRAREGATIFFDLDDDPKELRGLPWPANLDASRLTDLARADPDPAGVPIRMASGMRLNAPKVAPTVDDEALKRLRSLGYVR